MSKRITKTQLEQQLKTTQAMLERTQVIVVELRETLRRANAREDKLLEFLLFAGKEGRLPRA